MDTHEKKFMFENESLSGLRRFGITVITTVVTIHGWPMAHESMEVYGAAGDL